MLKSGGEILAVVLGIPKEIAEDENRVSVVPDSVKKLGNQGIEVMVQSGAGEGAYFTDEHYRANGATVVKSREELFHSSNIVGTVQCPNSGDIGNMSEESILVGLLSPESNSHIIEVAASRGVTSFSLDRMPRTTRAQSMDVLTSQSSVSGYVGAILAAVNSPRLMPMLTTAAGTVKPSKVLVLGAGVAGLMTIATLRRLGAVVTAYDVRKPAREDVRSLGAKFLNLDIEASTTGGYARELTKEEKEKQQELLEKAMTDSDVIITTASVPGRKAPLLIPGESVEKMVPGTVIIDLSADSGGNCELTKRGKVVEYHNGVKIIGVANPASRMPVNASEMYSRNMVAFLELIVKDGTIDQSFSDELLKSCRVMETGRSK